MKKIIATIIISLTLPVSVLAYGEVGGGSITFGVAPTIIVHPFNYHASLERRILELRLQIAQLQLVILKLHYRHHFFR